MVMSVACVAESASDSDFADDEMSPAIRISKDGSCQDDSNLVNELSKFHDGPTSALRDFCTWNSKPGDSDYAFDHGQALIAEPALDTPIPSAGETSRSDSKREVQKDVIMVQTESSSKYESMDTAALYKQEYLDELLQQIRFQIPTAEVKGTGIADNSYTKISEGHLDELLEQVCLPPTFSCGTKLCKLCVTIPSYRKPSDGGEGPGRS